MVRHRLGKRVSTIMSAHTFCLTDPGVEAALLALVQVADYVILAVSHLLGPPILVQDAFEIMEPRRRGFFLLNVDHRR